MTVGITLILALVAALVAPIFIDWSAYRTTFEEYAGQALGQRVSVLGSADARLLPTPTLTFSDVRVGEAEDPLMVISHFKVRVELPPLLTGKIQVVDMQLERPRLNLSLDELGRIDWLTARVPGSDTALDPDDVQLQEVEISDGSMRLIDARTGKTYRADNINLQISARSLDGPFKADGSAQVAGVHQSLRIATGRRSAQGIRVKADIQPTNIAATLQADGIVSHEDGKPVYAGTFFAESVMPAEEGGESASLEPAARLWRSEGAFTLDPGRLEIDKANLRYGPEDRAIRLEGDGGMDFGAVPAFTARLAAKQIDLDRLSGKGPRAPVSIAGGAGAIMAAIKTLPMPPVPGSFRLDLPALVAAGGLAQDIRLEASTLPRGWRIETLEARLPGQTRFAGRGELRVSDEPAFSGRVEFACAQPSGFAAWWRGTGGGAPLSLAPFSVAAHVEAAPDGIAFNGLEGELGDATLRGDVTWRAARDQTRARVAANLEADRLDLDQLAVLGSVIRGESGDEASGPDDGAARLDADYSLSLDADTLVYAGVEADRVRVEASLAGDDLEVQRFSAQDLAGATIDASGRIAKLSSAPDGAFTASVRAGEVDGLIAVLNQAFPDNALMNRLSAGEGQLAPIDVSASVTARAEADDRSHVEMSLAGTLANSKLDAALKASGSVDRWREADVAANVSLKSDDAVQILGQLGADVVPLPGMGPGAITLKVIGAAGEGLSVTMVADGLDASASFDGTLTLSDAAGGAGPVYQGALAFKSDDVSPIGMLGGRLLPMMSGENPVDVSAKLDGAGYSVALSDMSARLGDVTLRGDLDAVLGGPAKRVSGTVAASQVSLARLSEVLLGADAWTSVQGGAKASHWPNAAFGVPLMGDGTVSLKVTAGAVDVGLSRTVRQAEFDLQIRRDELAVDDFSGSFEGGRAVGALLIRRSGAQAAVSGTLGLSGVSLRNLVWSRNDRPVASGLFDAKADFEGIGRSISGVVAGLAGGGSFTVHDGEILSVNPAAFASVIRAVDAGLDLKPEEIERVFASHLDAGSLPFQRIDGALVIAAGTARARNVTIDSDSATAFGSAQIGLESWQLSSDWSLKVDPGENAVTGAEPQVGVLFRGPLDDPSREIDIQPFTAFLTLRAFEKEVRRVEELQADINERDRLMRELRQLRRNKVKRDRANREKAEAEARRNDEEAAVRIEAEKAAREKAQAAEAKRRAAEEKRKSEAAAAAAAAKKAEEDGPPVSMEDFIKRIRPAIDGDRSDASGDTGAGGAGARGDGTPMPLDSGLGAPITIDPRPITPLTPAGGETTGSTGSIAGDRAPQRTSPPVLQKPKPPRFITVPGSVRVVPNPEYPGN
ncbi:AsmA family protein [Breoghania sp.]|uniref:AsmA family protein n=1 Tax=Breoghania sp. TaxID=2065378 RepID=UPI002D1E47A3|nr:AsmA family protein [Breoghania sp.]